MTRMPRHARPTSYLWRTVLGALIGMVVGVVVFAIIWEAIR